MKIRLRESDIHLVSLHTRMPFKYGIATMTQMPMAFVRVRAEIDGKVHTGIASDLLPPKWFKKDPQQSPVEEFSEMSLVLARAAQTATGLAGDSAFDLWRQIYPRQDEWGRSSGLPPLLAHFGTSLIERALIEAVCRAAQQPFHLALKGGLLGFRPEAVHPSLKPGCLFDSLPEGPLASVLARHTVGLVDHLTEAEIPAGERLLDGLPQSLEACVRHYGLRHFKLKVSGRIEADLERLGRIFNVLRQTTGGDFKFTLDGNEQFATVEDFRAFWEQLKVRDDWPALEKRLLFVEQPVHRDAALQPSVGMAFADWPDHPSVIIDESDGEIESLPRALELGYAGTSHKNCKGIFKGVANACLLAARRQSHPGRPALQSGEDLCNIGPIALLQDLAVMAALGIESVERNGHHYCAGLSLFPARIQRQVLAAHPDVYQPSEAGWPTVAIDQGRINVSSLNRAPFGVGFELAVEEAGGDCMAHFESTA